jgi:20S proteasome subunit beta 2
MYCCGAGTAADTQFTIELISSQLELHRLTTGRESRLASALVLFKQLLFRYQGYIGAHLIIGGVDITGPKLYTVAPHGSTEILPFVAMGSGCLAALSMLENGWKKNLEVN